MKKHYAKNEPATRITKREDGDNILRMGSVLSIINNKKINPAKLLVAILENKDYRDCFMEIMVVDDERELVSLIIAHYPNIVTSKIVNRQINKG